MSQPISFSNPSSPIGAGIAPRMVHLVGELDLATRFEVHQACVTGDNPDVVVDLSRVTFMDCSAYGGLIATAFELQNAHGSLSIVNRSGQPARFLALVAAMFETSNGQVCQI